MRATIALTAVAATLVGCGGSKHDEAHSASPTSASATSTSASAAPQAKIAPLPDGPGPNQTIAGYIAQNGITQTPVHSGDPGAPVITLPVPDGWTDAAADAPATAYYAIANHGPEAGKYTPSVVAYVTKLTGNVDQQQLLDLAPGQLKNLPGFTAMSDGSATTLSGFPGFQIGGTWTPNGQKRGVAQKTVVIASGENTYLMQLTADCLEEQLDLVVPATMDIDEGTTITP